MDNTFMLAVPLSSRISCIEKILDSVRFSCVMAIKDIKHYANADTDQYVFAFTPFFKLSDADIECYKAYLQLKLDTKLEVFHATHQDSNPATAS